MPDRILKVNELIKQELSKLLLTEFEFPQGSLVTITGVGTSRDMGYAKVWLSIFPASQAPVILKIVYKRTAYLQALLNRKLTFKILPKIHFYLDDSEEKASVIDSLLDNLKNKGYN